jgi:hypothetical protein
MPHITPVADVLPVLEILPDGNCFGILFKLVA